MSNLKGWWGEKIAQFGFWIFLDNKIYRRLHNVILETGNGTTQVDHVYLSRYGIFVIETKHMKGWIFGSEKDKQWTQKFRGGKSFKFQNPLRQNYRHVKAISEALAADEQHVHSIILFISDDRLQLKTPMPENVTRSPFVATRYIKRFTEPVFSDEELSRFENELQAIKDSQISTREHVENIKNRYAQTDTCPKCGSAMVRRVGKKDSNKGNVYMACSAFPKCHYMVDTGEVSYEPEPENMPEQENVQESENPYESTDKCPQCGNALVQRVGKTGERKGKIFMGCSTFPKCRYMSEPYLQEVPKQDKAPEAKKDEAAEKCPKCGNALVQRITKAGNNKGNVFMGCSTYPKCRYMSSMEK